MSEQKVEVWHNGNKGDVYIDGVRIRHVDEIGIDAASQDSQAMLRLTISFDVFDFQVKQGARPGEDSSDQFTQLYEYVKHWNDIGVPGERRK